MKIDILTLFPKMFKGPFEESMLKKAQEKELLEIKIHNLRDWAKDKRKSVDDRPYGGGAGMIMRVDIIDSALKDLRSQKSKVILLDAAGKTFNQKIAHKLSKENNLILISGHYEGLDHRIHEHLVDEVISIGNFVLTGGEIPAMVLTDAIARLIPGVLDPESLKEESFSNLSSNIYNLKPILEYPQYTRPEVYKGWKVPEVLLSGNHAEIKKWRAKKARPDPLSKKQ